MAALDRLALVFERKEARSFLIVADERGLRFFFDERLIHLHAVEGDLIAGVLLLFLDRDDLVARLFDRCELLLGTIRIGSRERAESAAICAALPRIAPAVALTEEAASARPACNADVSAVNVMVTSSVMGCSPTVRW